MSEYYGQTLFYKVCNKIVETSVFSTLMLLAIGTNTVSMSLDRYPISDEELTLLELINNVCTWIFIGEMLLKIAGLGIVTYVTDAVNLFDGFVVIVSIIELGMEVASNSNNDDQESSGNMTLTIFRAFRLLRVFRLARQWHSFHRMTTKMMETAKDIAIFFILLLIIVLVFSLLGVELFNNYAKFDTMNRAV